MPTQETVSAAPTRAGRRTPVLDAQPFDSPAVFTLPQKVPRDSARAVWGWFLGPVFYLGRGARAKKLGFVSAGPR